MSVKLEWVPAIEASDRRNAGWVEVELHHGIEAAPWHFLMASPVEENEPAQPEPTTADRTQPVGITEELESVLRSAKEYEMAVRTGTRVEWHAYDAGRIGAAIAAVRSQYRRKG